MIGTDHYLEAEKLLGTAVLKAAEADKARRDGAVSTILATLRATLLAQADAADAAAKVARETAAVHATLAQVCASLTPVIIAYRQVRKQTPMADAEVDRWATVVGAV